MSSSRLSDAATIHELLTQYRAECQKARDAWWDRIADTVGEAVSRPALDLSEQRAALLDAIRVEMVRPQFRTALAAILAALRTKPWPMDRLATHLLISALEEWA